MGPSAAVLLSYLPGTGEVKSFDQWVEEIDPSLEHSLGIPEADDFGELSDEERREILFHTSFLVRSWYSLVSPTNSKKDHEHLGRACLSVARAAQGLIDFGGALLPPLPSPMLRGMWLWEHAQWSDIEPYFHEMVQHIPGKVFTLPYQTAGGRIWACHLCDVQFMENWLAHSRFHMIK